LWADIEYHRLEVRVGHGLVLDGKVKGREIVRHTLQTSVKVVPAVGDVAEEWPVKPFVSEEVDEPKFVELLCLRQEVLERRL
jgi:hypothetical protein